jgi:3-oxosteroid 1-dehydrogenase
MGRSRRVVDAGAVTWTATYDVVVVGAGAGGLAAALNAASLGASVIVLEKAPQPGGTMKKSAAWYWIPNNAYMRDEGKRDDRDAFLRYVARLSRPQSYDPASRFCGLAQWEYEAAAAFYDHAGAANDALAAMGAIKPLYSPAIPDYHATLPEATVPFGRTLLIDRGDGQPGKGDVLTAQMLAACETLHVPILCAHRVEGVIADESGALVGVYAATAVEPAKAFKARQAVIFASGGFTHNRELRRNFLSPVIVSGCAAPTNEGDFVRIATALGLPLGNMSSAWLAPIPFEIALQESPYLSGMFAVPGDSMIWVDRCGRRVVNEKTIYNELAMSFTIYDPARLEYPRLLMFMIWDERTARLWKAVDEHPPASPSRLALDNYGNVIYDGVHVLTGATLDELAASLDARLGRLAPHTGGFRLDPDFRRNLGAAIARFNELAARGTDEDLHRGENPIELVFNGPAREGNDTGNPTMFPMSPAGPYYATIVCAGTLDTKGGPFTNPNGQVLDLEDEPVAGLYAVGNCAANPTGQAYVAGGGTIGPCFTFAYLAARHAVQQPRR